MKPEIGGERLAGDPRCRVEMLGPLRLIRGGETVTRLGTPKAAFLLTYLALRPGAQSREGIIDLFWPEMDLPEGRNNLNTTLSGLRRLLEPPGVRRGTVLTTSHAAVGLDPAAVATDVAEFERGCDEAASAADPTDRAERWGRAVALVRGEFQAGNYQDWAVREAERLLVRLAGAWDGLGDALEALGRWTEAADVAQRRLDADPYADAAHAALIRRRMRAGQRDRAREAARRSTVFYRDEFGGEPPRVVRDAIAEALSGPPISPRPPVSPPVLSPVPSPPPRTTDEEPREILPPILTAPFWLSRFFGRDADAAQLAGLLLPAKGPPGDRAPHPVRLVTLTGTGGTGKTRLAGEFLRQARDRFGAWCGFVPLADLTAPEQVPAQIVHALGLPPASDRSPLDQAVAFFQGRERPPAAPMLLVLDNAEHLMDPAEHGAEGALAGTVRELLERTSGLSVLCTSRRLLGLHGERRVPLAPLPLPEPTLWEDPDALAALGRVPSVALYVDRAQTVRPDFGLTPVNGPAVARLCHQLEGSPLALELAASWVRLLPPRRMWERLEQGQALPAGRDADRPARHRSLDAALEWSWRLLPPAQQRLLACLSVFRGGWTLRAAEEIGDTPDALTELAALEEASLALSREDADGEVRFSLLDVVRRFAGERLAQAGDDAAQDVRRRHAAFFFGLARDAAVHLRGPEQRPWLDALEADHDNLRAALDECVSAPGSLEEGLRAAAGLALFWRARGYLREGQERLRALLSRPEASARTGTRADALNRRGELVTLLTAYDDAQACHAEAREIAREVGDAGGEADALLGLGTVAYWHRDYPAAAARFQESLRRRPQEDWGTAATLHSLGNLALRWEEGGDARPFFERALALRRRQGDALGGAGALGALGQVALADNDYGAAVGYITEALTLFDAAGQRWTAALCLSGLSDVAEARGDVPRAVCLLGAASSLRERFHYPSPPAELAAHEERLDGLRACVGASAFDTAWAAGRAMSWEQTVAYALKEETTPSRPPPY